jgi:hypothetical protein
MSDLVYIFNFDVPIIKTFTFFACPVMLF